MTAILLSATSLGIHNHLPMQRTVGSSFRTAQSTDRKWQKSYFASPLVPDENKLTFCLGYFLIITAVEVCYLHWGIFPCWFSVHFVSH